MEKRFEISSIECILKITVKLIYLQPNVSMLPQLHPPLWYDLILLLYVDQSINTIFQKRSKYALKKISKYFWEATKDGIFVRSKGTVAKIIFRSRNMLFCNWKISSYTKHLPLITSKAAIFAISKWYLFYWNRDYRYRDIYTSISSIIFWEVWYIIIKKPDFKTS